MPEVTISALIMELEAIDREYRSGLAGREVTCERLHEIGVETLKLEGRLRHEHLR